MRPHAHWHLNHGRNKNRWWAAAVVAALVLVAVVALQVRAFAGGGGPGDALDASNRCGTPLECAQQAQGPTFGAEPAASEASGRAVAVVEASCGALLYGQREDVRLKPASLTKIATALVAYERSDLEASVNVRVNSGLLVASTGSTVMGLKPGVELTMRDLMHGLLLVSGNDAAIAIAEEVAGTTSRFVELMNAKAAELGLSDTHFTNPHGLDEAGLYTTAYEVALLGRALLAEPELAGIVSATSYQATWEGPLLYNGNALLERYPGAVGVKIGYTEGAGQTIVAAAERDGRRLIVTVLGSLDRYADAIALFDWAFENTQPSC